MCNKSRTGTLVALLLLIGAVAASAQEVTPAERHKVIHFEIAASNSERATNSYKNGLGWNTFAFREATAQKVTTA